MPDFSINPKGWGAGEHASNVKAYLAVMEEYATGNVSILILVCRRLTFRCQGTLGSRFSLTYNTVRYNVTKHHGRRELPALV